MPCQSPIETNQGFDLIGYWLCAGEPSEHVLPHSRIDVRLHLHYLPIGEGVQDTQHDFRRKTSAWLIMIKQFATSLTIDVHPARFYFSGFILGSAGQHR